MDLEYNVTTEDFIAFNLYHFRNSPAVQRQILITRFFLSCVVIVLTLALISFLSRDKPFSLLIFIGPIIGGALFFLLYPRLIEPSIKKQIQKLLSEGTNDGVIGKQKLILTAIPSPISWDRLMSRRTTITQANRLRA